MFTNFQKVCQFNKSFGLPHNDSLILNILDNESLASLRINLIKEEIGELNDAVNTKNFIEVIDALSDILYVIYGAGSSYGINLDNEFDNRLKNFYFYENKNNYSNHECIKDYLINNAKLNIPNSIQSNVFDLDLNKDIYEILDSINDDFTHLEIYNTKKNLVAVNTYLNRLLYLTYKFGVVLGINLDKSFSIVHDSNMSKLCKTKEEAEETVKYYKENEKRYDTPNYRKSDFGDYFVVYNESTGKILKSINYTPANFSSLLN